MKWILATLCVMGFLGCKPEAEPEPADHFLRVLSFPDIPLAEGERISGLQINMACGRFRAVNNIPNDWSLEIEGPVSECSTLKAMGNHGTSWLSDSSDLQDFVTILVCSTSHFDIAATVFTETRDDEGKKTFRRDQLKLKRLPHTESHPIAGKPGSE